MLTSQQNNKRIAKNTLLLYVRMLFLLIVNLFTSRVVLKALGVDDYGIYNVVGGIVAMFGVISGSMATSTQRHITFSLGNDDLKRTSKIFCAALQIHFVIAIVVFIAGETIGLWLLFNKFVIPPIEWLPLFGYCNVQ